MKTKQQLAEELFPETTFDYALPQQWVDDFQSRLPEDHPLKSNVSAHFVWIYPDGACWGIAGALTLEGAEALAQLQAEAI